MKCRRHNQEEGAGVCASCLRERLRDLVAVRADHSLPNPPSPRPQQHPQAQVQARSQSLPLPSSVHPLSCRLPHVSSGSTESGPSSNSAAAGRRSGSTMLSILSTLFGRHHNRRRSRSEEAEPDRGAPKSPPSGHWFPGFTHGHQKRKKKKKKKKISRLASADDAMATRPRMSCRGRERGLSPESGGSAPESGYNTESPGRGWWRPTPSPRRLHTAEHYHHGRGLAGFAVCLSPLVRPGGPSRRRFQGWDLGFPDDVQRAVSPHHRPQAAGAEPALCRRRSRKLADLGRVR